MDNKTDGNTSRTARGYCSVSLLTLLWSQILKHNLFSARKVDKKTANEIHDSLQLGTQVNSRNDDLNRLTRNTQRNSKAAQKAKTIRNDVTLQSTLRETIESEKTARKISMQRQKDAADELKILQATSAMPRKTHRSRITPTHIVHADSLPVASSSGRVASSTHSLRKENLRLAARPYPACEYSNRSV